MSVGTYHPCASSDDTVLPAIALGRSNNGWGETPMNIKFVIVHFSRAILLSDARRGRCARASMCSHPGFTGRQYIRDLMQR